jgi:hypothetical protein
VLKAAKDGKGHEPSARGWRLPQFRIGVRDPMDRLRGARAAAIAAELTDDGSGSRVLRENSYRH